jgi:hypothetical protein
VQIKVRPAVLITYLHAAVERALKPKRICRAARCPNAANSTASRVLFWQTRNGFTPKVTDPSGVMAGGWLVDALGSEADFEKRPARSREKR